LRNSERAVRWPSNIVRLDLRKPLPFGDGEFDVVYSSHAIEHLERDAAQRLLAECARLVRPGGICRMVVPDLASCVDRYQAARKSGDDRAADKFMEELSVHTPDHRGGVIGLYRQMTRFNDHKWMYDAASLQARLVESGFGDARRRDCFDSDIAEIREVEEE